MHVGLEMKQSGRDMMMIQRGGMRCGLDHLLRAKCNYSIDEVRDLVSLKLDCQVQNNQYRNKHQSKLVVPIELTSGYKEYQLVVLHQ
jgi:hypothetical protein